VALVTGAAGGLGRAVAQELVSTYEVICIDIDSTRLDSLQEELRAANTTGIHSTNLHTREIDLSDPAAIRELFADNALPWSRLCSVVHAAGIAEGDDIFELSLEDWQRDIALNLTATFLITQAACHLMHQHQQQGSIVMTSSLAGVAGARKPNYAASKAGVLGLMKSVAQKAGPDIRCNAIVPGAIDTPLIADWDEAKRDKIAGNTPLQRIADPSEIASVIEFLLSERASFITGATINVSGGQWHG
jgi:NAD(P)-dependent dehydrogenase (short-subunit alcohol dehydrogenase family)